MALRIDDKIVQTFPEPNIADIYGTYPTVEIANIAVEAANVKCAGLTVGIKNAITGVVTEYWYQPDGQGGLELVEKKESTVVNGYYDALTDTFYLDLAKSTPVIGETDKLYVDATTNAMYRYDITDGGFVQLNETSGQKRVYGTLTDKRLKAVIGGIGDTATYDEHGNVHHRYYDLKVKKGDVVHYKAVEHRSPVNISANAGTQPVVFVDSNGVIRLKPNNTTQGNPISGDYAAPDNGTFTINVRDNERPSGSGNYVWDDNYLYKVVEQEGVDERVDGLVESVNALQGKDGFKMSVDTLTDGQDIDLTQAFPHMNKFGNTIQLVAKVDAFGAIKFSFGSAGNDVIDAYDYRLLTIDSTDIKLYKVTTSPEGSLVESVAHGLAISTYLSVNLDCLADGTMRINLTTMDNGLNNKGSFSAILTNWKYGVGRIKIISDGSSFSDILLSASNRMFRSQLWMFGASQEGIKDDRYAGQLKKLGYLNVLNNARSGRNSEYALQDLTRALRFGHPKYLYFSLSNDGYNPEVYEPRLQAVVNLAAEQGFTLITMARPVHQQVEGDGNATVQEQLAKRQYIIETSPRVFDFGKAVSADPTDPEGIYQGYLDSNYLHPANAKAANAVAMQFLADVPEIMQYGRVDFDDDEREALHSGINAIKVAKLDALPTNAVLQEQLDGKVGTAAPITYAALKALRDGGNLVSGRWYRITDYACTTMQTGTQSAKHAFDIIVRADNARHLNENGYAAHHKDDTYFATCKLEAWELKYSIDNDANRFAWADPEEGKGVVYWMKDEWNNQAPYDFKNIMFLRDSQWLTDHGSWVGSIMPSLTLEDTYFYLFSWFVFQSGEQSIFDASIVCQIITDEEHSCFGVHDNTIMSRVYEGSKGQTCYSLPNNIIINSIEYNNGFFHGCYGIMIGSQCRDITIGSECYNITVGNKCYNITIDGSNNIVIGGECSNDELMKCGYITIFAGACNFGIKPIKRVSNVQVYSGDYGTAVLSVLEDALFTQIAALDDNNVPIIWNPANFVH